MSALWFECVQKWCMGERSLAHSHHSATLHLWAQCERKRGNILMRSTCVKWWLTRTIVKWCGHDERWLYLIILTIFSWRNRSSESVLTTTRGPKIFFLPCLSYLRKSAHTPRILRDYPIQALAKMEKNYSAELKISKIIFWFFSPIMIVEIKDFFSFNI